MKSSTGRWVSGADFFDREPELQILESRAHDRNHVLLSGQRRMGKTSVLHELGRRLEDRGWDFLFTDVEGATCPEDVIADVAEAAHPIRSLSSRFVDAMGRLVKENVEEIGARISAQDFRVKIRAGLTAGARRCLEGLYSKMSADAPGRLEDALEVLAHDGYLEVGDGGYRFPSRLLKDWWAARFRDHHTSLESRFSDRGRGVVR